jgi:DDE superfamily endonuclease
MRPRQLSSPRPRARPNPSPELPALPGPSHRDRIANHLRLAVSSWTASYRLFSKLRLDPAQLFAGIRSACLEQLPVSDPVMISIDDSLLPKTGPKIAGVAWRREPQGPPFQTNFIRAQRVLQFSALLPLPDSPTVRYSD